jgi:ribokinase
MMILPQIDLRNAAASAADLPAPLFSSDTVSVLQMEVPFAQSLEVARRTKAASGVVIWNLAPGPGEDDIRRAAGSA